MVPILSNFPPAYCFTILADGMWLNLVEDNISGNSLK